MTVVLYKVPGPKKIDGVECDSVFVDESEVEDYIAQGWVKGGPHAALAAKEEPKEVSDDVRIELEAKATALGISFDGRTSNAKLAERIKEAEEA